MAKKSGTAGGLPPIGKRAGHDDDGFDENPFRMPNDDRIFRIREEEKKKKLESMAMSNSQMKIWQRSQPTMVSRSQRLRDLVGEKLETSMNSKYNTDDDQNKVTASHHRQEKENMTEFIAKKREMFLVQMSLDTKREEIRKLEEKAQMKEEALQRSEQMLEEDSSRFEAFLKENDNKALEAINLAEVESKKKQEKIQEIKRLNHQIDALTSEMSKHKESLEECLKYKIFLDRLTPPEFFEEHERRQYEKRENMRREQHAQHMREWESIRKRIIDQHRREVEAKKEQKKVGRRGRNAAVEDEEDEDNDWKLAIPPPPRIEDEVVDMPYEEPPMYFTHPQQLMDIFAASEEQSLCLIQNSQDTEHTLEDLQHAYKNTKSTMEAEARAQNAHIAELQSQIAAEKSRAQALKQKRLLAGDSGATAASTDKKDKAATAAQLAQAQGQSQEAKEKLLSELTEKVRQVYEQCVDHSSSRPSTIYMLSELERRLESLLQEIDLMPPEEVARKEKEKERKRRADKVMKAMLKKEEDRKDSNERAKLRSLQAPKKRTGRMVMFRSRPVLTDNRKTGDDSNDNNNNDELLFLS